MLHKKVHKFLLNIFLVFCLPICELQAVTYGSDAEPSWFDYALFFQADDTDNKVFGFTKLDDGFVLENASTTCTVDVQFPIRGEIVCNGGTLELSNDVVIPTGGTLSGGTLDGNGYQLYYNSVANIDLPERYSSTQPLQQLASSIAAGDQAPRSVDWSFDGKYICSGTYAGNIRIYEYGGSLTLKDTYSVVGDVLAVAWQPNSYYFAATDSEELVILEFDPVTDSVSSVTSYPMGTACIIQALDWSPSGQYLAVHVKDVLSGGNPEVRVFEFNAPNITIIDTYIESALDVTRESISWDSTGQYFATAYHYNNAGTTRSYLAVYSFNGSSITPIITNDLAGLSYGLDWSDKDGYIALGCIFNSGGNYILGRKFFSSGIISVQNILISATRSNKPNSVKWSHGGNYLVYGTERGSVPSTFRLYAFDATSETFSLVASESSYTDESIWSVAWSNTNEQIARGGSSYLNFFRPVVRIFRGITPQDFPELTVNNIKLSFNADVSLTAPVLFQGTSEIDAMNNSLSMTGTSGKIMLDTDASLLIKNARIENIQEGSVVLGSGSSLALSDVKWYQDSDFTFTQGVFDFYNDVVISGSGSFIYSSDGVSYIHENSTLFFDSGMTFSYFPSGSSRRYKLLFTDSSAALHLYEATLAVQSLGIRLRGGTVIVEGLCPIYSDATAQVDGIWIGDQATQYNTNLKILPESGFDIRSGCLAYKNV